MGAEAVSGLGRAFFYAGARSLLISNWPVETSSAKVLTKKLFAIQSDNADQDRVEALRQAMIETISKGVARGSQGKIAFSYAHPLFWAPYTLVGESGSAPQNR